MRKLALGAIADIVSGATPRSGVEGFWGGDVLWATPADLSKIDGPYLATTPRTITAAGLASCAATVLPAGSVLLSSRAPIGHVAINTEPMATNQGFKSIVPHAGAVHAKYLYHWLRSKTDYLQSLGNGATFKEVSKATVARIEIALPTIEDQRRIAAILDHADHLRSVRSQVSARLHELTRSTFWEMFGDPLRNPRRLPTRCIGSLAEVVTGNSPPRTDPSNYGNYIEWIKSDNLGGDVATRAREWLSRTGSRAGRIAPAGATLVTCIAGSAASIGKSSVVDRDVAFNQQINAILPSSMINSVFLVEQLKVAPELVRRRSTGGMKGLVSKSSFQSIDVIVPPLDDQLLFAARAARAKAHRALVYRQIAAQDLLFASLQSRAFRGEL